jgi:hypothetical protein
MTWRGLVCGAIFLGGYGFCFSGVAAGSDQSGGAANANPYALISERNPFRMNPPPPPPDPNAAAPAPELPKVIFSGTMVNAGHMNAMFAYETKEPKDPKAKPAPGPQDTTTYICLAEGDVSGPVQLLKIMKGGDEVEIMNSGTRMTLNMKDNGFGKDTASAGRGGGPAGVIHNLPGANVPAPVPPGQPVAQPGGNGGIISGGAGGESYRGGFNAAGINAANPSGGTLTGGAPINRAGLSQSGVNPQTSSGTYNSGNIISGGNTVAAAPATTTMPNGMNTLPSMSGNLGSQSSMQPNNTPISTTPMRNVIMPPMPQAPGQQKD